MTAICRVCSADFKTFPCWIKKGGGKYCSYECMGVSRRGRNTYIRTLQQNSKMSALKKAEDQSSNRERFLRINALKKGKTIEELYPDKAVRLREFKRQQVAEKNPNWRGGKHRNRYPFIFFKLRQGILDRDNHTCQNCEMTELEAISKDRYGRGLTIHHIDYDKENNVLDNLITLCKWCNSSANSRRQEWQMFYQSKLAG